MAGELALGTILNYQGNANNALGSGNYGNETLLDTTPATNAALAQFGAFIQKKQDDEYRDYHNNMVNTIASVKKTDGIYSGDAEKVNESLKKVISNLVNNPSSLRSDAFLKDPQGYQDQQAALGDHAVLVQQSKDFNALLKGWEKATTTTSDLNNEVNALQIEQLKKASPEERVTLIEKIHPISDGDKELQVFETTFYKNPSQRLIGSSVNSVDAGMVDTVTTGKYDYNTYLQGFMAAKGQYLSKKFELDNRLQEQFAGDVNAYIQSEAKARFAEQKVIDKITQKPNEAIKEQGRNDRNDDNNATKIQIAKINAQNRKELVQEKAKLEQTGGGKFPENIQAINDLIVLDDKFEEQGSKMGGAFDKIKGDASVISNDKLPETLRSKISQKEFEVEYIDGAKKEAANNLTRRVNASGARYYPTWIGEVDGETKVLIDENRAYTRQQMRDLMVSSSKELAEYKLLYGSSIPEEPIVEETTIVTPTGNPTKTKKRKAY